MLLKFTDLISPLSVGSKLLQQKNKINKKNFRNNKKFQMESECEINEEL